MTTKPTAKTPSRDARRKPAAPPERHAASHPRSVPIQEPDPDDARDPDQPFAEGAYDAMDPDLRHRLISEAAYNLYRQRGFADGYDLDDWLQAEESVDHLLVDRPGRVRRAGE